MCSRHGLLLLVWPGCAYLNGPSPAHNRSSGHPIMQSYEPGDPFAAMARALGVGIASAATLVPSDFEFGRSCPADAEGVQPIGAGTTVVETFDPEMLITGTAPCRSPRW